MGFRPWGLGRHFTGIPAILKPRWDKVKPMKGWGVYTAVVLAVLGAASWYFYEKAHEIRRHVILFQKDKATEVLTAKKTVEDVLREQGIVLEAPGRGGPALTDCGNRGDGDRIGAGGPASKGGEKDNSLRHAHGLHRYLERGRDHRYRAGQGRFGRRETETFNLNGEEAFEKVLKSTVLVPAKNAKVLEGTALKQKLYPLRKRARVWKTITLPATAYYPGPEDTWPYTAGYTASGLKAGYGVVAVDPRFIRMKTPIYVEGYGYAIAADKGGAIKGNKIDLCFDTYEEAVSFGRKNVKVYLLR